MYRPFRPVQGVFSLYKDCTVYTVSQVQHVHMNCKTHVRAVGTVTYLQLPAGDSVSPFTGPRRILCGPVLLSFASSLRVKLFFRGGGGGGGGPSSHTVNRSLSRTPDLHRCIFTMHIELNTSIYSIGNDRNRWIKEILAKRLLQYVCNYYSLEIKYVTR
jgi:hypothetical protein